MYNDIVAKCHLLVFINRSVGGKDYDALVDALGRLDGTRIRTNVKTGGETNYEGFGRIESFKLRRSEKSGRILEIAVKLSDWVFRSIEAKEVLTLHKDYFRLKKPIDARVYAGDCPQTLWQTGQLENLPMELLKLKCDSRTRSRACRHSE